LRRISQDKVAEILRLRALEFQPDDIATRLGVERSTVYNYLAKCQAFTDQAFIEELQRELSVFHKLYNDGKEQFIPISGQTSWLAQLLRKYLFMPEELLAQAILNAHWKRLKACRKQKHST